MRTCSWLAVTLAMGCGAPPAPTAAPAPAPSAKAVGKPRCGPDTDSSPADAQAKMKGLEGDVRACFTLGTPGKLSPTVQVEVTVLESGTVKAVHVVGVTGNKSGETCVAERLRKANFAAFCGAEAEIRWTYSLQ